MFEPDFATILADALVAWVGVVLLFFAWRGIGHMPILARLMTSLALAVTILGSFGLVLLTFGADGHALVREPNLPWLRRGNVAEATSPRPHAPEPSAVVAAPPADVAAVRQQIDDEPVAAAREPAKSIDAAGPSIGRNDHDAVTASSAQPPAAHPAPPASVAATDERPHETAPVAAAAPALEAGPAPETVVGALAPAATRPAPPLPAPPSPPASASPPVAADARMTVLFGTDRAPDARDGGKLSARRGGRLLLGKAMIDTKSATAGASASWASRVVDAAARATGAGGDGIELVDRQRWAASVGEKRAADPARRALVYVHGYNTTLEAALERAASLAREVGFEGLVVVYSWPSQGRIASYSYDLESARQSEPYLREFLADVIAGSGIKSVSVLGEGIGAGPVLDALAELRGASRGEDHKAGLVLDQIMLAAPDLDARRLQALTAKLGGHVGGVTLYAAADDRALKVARRFHGGLPRAGDVARGEPVVLAGVDTIVVSPADSAAATGDASPSAAPIARQPAAMIGDMAALLRTGLRPPDQRGAMQRIAARGGGYFWRLTP